uniref:Uncharacterized protein n=1 Tax=Oryza glumipatula TaxID=40148 RepID=A0A0E0BB29_9ORYZ
MPISKIANHWVGYLGVNGEEVEVKPMAWWLGLQRSTAPGTVTTDEATRIAPNTSDWAEGITLAATALPPPPLPCHRQSEQPGYSSVRKDGGSGVESCEAAGPILCEGEGDDAQ